MDKLHWYYLYYTDKPKYNRLDNLQDAALFYLNELLYVIKKNSTKNDVIWYQKMVIRHLRLLSAECESIKNEVCNSIRSRHVKRVKFEN